MWYVRLNLCDCQRNLYYDPLHYHQRHQEYHPIALMTMADTTPRNSWKSLLVFDNIVNHWFAVNSQIVSLLVQFLDSSFIEAFCKFRKKKNLVTFHNLLENMKSKPQFVLNSPLDQRFSSRSSAKSIDSKAAYFHSSAITRFQTNNVVKRPSNCCFHQLELPLCNRQTNFRFRFGITSPCQLNVNIFFIARRK